MLIDPSYLAGKYERGDPTTFENFLNQNNQNKDEVIVQQNPLNINNLNMGTGHLAYLIGAGPYPEGTYPDQYSFFEKGFRVGAPPSTEKLKNAFALWAGAPTS
jgi:hypothetical protein